MNSEKKILIVDDEAVVREVLSRILSKKNYEITYAEDGESAIKHVGRTKFDLILLDLRLPGIYGIEVLKEIKKINKDIPVILISAYLTNSGIKEAAEIGIVGYIKKPFDVKQVISAVEKALKIKRNN